MPVKDAAMQMKTRIAGLGSLGHPRILALFQWHGAHIVREAKALTRSGWIWASDGKQLDAPLLQEQIISSAVRVRDPHLHFHDNWVIRRLAPDCCRIELASLPDERDEERLLYAMGWETANIHLGSGKKISAVKKDLGARRGRWLHKAAKSHGCGNAKRLEGVAKGVAGAAWRRLSARRSDASCTTVRLS
jgi:hypothetical protein